MIKKTLSFLYQSQQTFRFAHRTYWLLSYIWPYYFVIGSPPTASKSGTIDPLEKIQENYQWQWRNWIFIDHLTLGQGYAEFVRMKDSRTTDKRTLIFQDQSMSDFGHIVHPLDQLLR